MVWDVLVVEDFFNGFGFFLVVVYNIDISFEFFDYYLVDYIIDGCIIFFVIGYLCIVWKMLVWVLGLVVE